MQCMFSSSLLSPFFLIPAPHFPDRRIQNFFLLPVRRCSPFLLSVAPSKFSFITRIIFSFRIEHLAFSFTLCHLLRFIFCSLIQPQPRTSFAFCFFVFVCNDCARDLLFSFSGKKTESASCFLCTGVCVLDVKRNITVLAFGIESANVALYLGLLMCT